MKKIILVMILFIEGAWAQTPGVFNLVAARPMKCDFRNLYPAQADDCEMAVVYEKNEKIVTVFLFKSRKDPSADYNKFLQDNSIGEVVTTFDLETVFETTDPILSFSAAFQPDNETLKFRARFQEEGSTQVEKTVTF